MDGRKEESMNAPVILGARVVQCLFRCLPKTWFILLHPGSVAVLIIDGCRHHIRNTLYSVRMDAMMDAKNSVQCQLASK